MFRSFIIIILIATGLFFIGWLGFQIEPSSFIIKEREEIKNIQSREITDTLPAPFHTYIEKTTNKPVTDIHTAMVWGKARLKIAGIWVPARFRSYYDRGKSFYREMEVTWFSRPILKGIDSFINGKGRFVMGSNKREGINVSRGQKLTMWTEAVWLPSAFATETDIKWKKLPEKEIINQIRIPFQDTLYALNIKINPNNHYIESIYGERQRGKGGQTATWRINYSQWKTFHQVTIPTKISVSWDDQEEPWSEFHVAGINLIRTFPIS